MSKLELFEQIRKDYFDGKKSIRQISKERHVHRRMVRQAIEQAIPPTRKAKQRDREVLTAKHLSAIDEWLCLDDKAPPKQRHTSRRMYVRLKDDHGYLGSESHLRRYVGRRKKQLSLSSKVFILQHYQAGEEAEVDWYEAYVDLGGRRCKLYFFQMRACLSKRLFTMAFFHQNQQAFLQGHVQAFEYYQGVFKTLRYDNLSSAVKRVLKGRKRIETERFIALWVFA